MRPKKPVEEKLRPVTMYLLPKVYRDLTAWAHHDRRSLSAMATFMVEHAISCEHFEIGHVPTDKIKGLQGQNK